MSDIVITEKQIDRWQQEKAELEETIRQSQAKLDIINRKLDAVALLGEKGEKKIAVLAPSVTTGPSGPEVVFDILFKAQTSMSPKQIRDKAINTDFPVEKWGKNFAYFYTALKRLLDSEKIMKDSEGRYYVPFGEIMGKDALSNKP